MAVLLGNGVSIAHNNELAVPKLTSDLIEEFKKVSEQVTIPGSSREDAAKALSELSKSVSVSSASPEENFEQLLSPLEDISDALQTLQGASALYSTIQPGIKGQLAAAATFCDHVRAIGLSHVLELVDRKARGGASGGVVSAFVDRLIQASQGGRILVGTLNYDHLVDSVMLDRYASMHSDMASGLQAVRVSLRADRRSNDVVARGLRSEFDFTMPDGWCWDQKRRVVTLHLHGSLSLLRDVDSGEVYRFRMQDLRQEGYWDLYRKRESRFEPVVVLTNQKRKSSLVQSYPFNKAYAGLSYGLISSERWLIAGYSFQDECVNEVLRDVWEVRKANPPKILVSTYGSTVGLPTLHRLFAADSPGRQARVNAVSQIHSAGLDALTDSSEWQDWLS